MSMFFLFNPLTPWIANMFGDHPQEMPPNFAAITSTSSQQDAVSREIPDSPITVMDPQTLSLFRLYIAVGLEVTYGNMTFSRDQDPFANIAIPQDVAHVVASRFNDVEID
ncbi:hypothetical protein LIER_37829 [Lithospermum erythrorhizon]|uniref:Uncharacterized protein n=1 Tax=Lithospermum erythrorhizon TaxID=34254 RepID=A0AAV3PR46_LITER